MKSSLLLLVAVGAIAGCASIEDVASPTEVDEPTYDETAVESIEQAVQGGAVVDSSDRRYAPLVQLLFRYGGYQTKCGGTLVGPTSVVTAAHCFYANTEARRLGVADAQLQDPKNWTITIDRYSTYAVTGEMRSASSILRHPTFRFSQPDGVRPFTGVDAATVTLSQASSVTPLRMVTSAQAGGINEGGTAGNELGFGAAVTIAGWGRTEWGTTTSLYSASMFLAGVGADCADLGILGGKVQSHELCAATYLWSANGCSGDSGGPILHSTAGVDQVAGIVSWRKVNLGYLCGDWTSPAVTTRGASVADWVESNIPGNWYISSAAKAGWQFLRSSNVRRSSLVVADFNGDRQDDVAYGDGSQWRVAWSARGDWKALSSERALPSSVLVGDFNGDGRSDLFITDGGRWYVRHSGTAARLDLGSSSIIASNLLVGDFDGNGRSDVLYANGSSWRVKWGGTGSWRTLATDTATKVSLRVADLNGDGRDDVVVTRSGRWYVRYGGTGELSSLTSSSVVAAELLVGDLNADGRDDLLYPSGASWRVKYAGTGAWARVNYAGGTASTLLLGRFNGEAGVDVLQATR